MAPLVADPVDHPNPHHITGHCRPAVSLTAQPAVAE